MPINYDSPRRHMLAQRLRSYASDIGQKSANPDHWKITPDEQAALERAERAILDAMNEIEDGPPR